MKRKVSLALVAMAVFAAVSVETQASDILWNSASGSAWLTGGNWTGGAVPTAADNAQFGVNPTGTGGVGINFNSTTNAGTQTNGQRIEDVGSIELTAARAAAMLIGNSASTAGATGNLRLLGDTVNSISNVVLRNNSSQNLTIQNTQSSGNQTMLVTLGNAVDNVVLIDGSGNITISSIVAGTGEHLSIRGAGSGDFVLSGTANSFDGGISISESGKLRLTGAGSLPTTGDISVSGDGRIRFGTTVGAATYGSSSQTVTFNPNGTVNNAMDIQGSNGTLATFNPNIVLTASARIESNGGNSVLTLAGNISGAGTLSKQASGTLVISGAANTFANLLIGNGRVKLDGGNNRLPTTMAPFFGQPSTAPSGTNNLGTLDLNGFNQELAGLVSNTGTNTNAASSNVVTSGAPATLTLSGSGTYGFGGSNASSGTVSGSVAIVKNGSGTQILGGTQTYDGTTTVNSGGLYIPGTLASSTVTVGGTGTFGGTGDGVTTGLFGAPVTVNSGGTIAPGSAPNTVGLMKVLAPLTFNSGGTYNVFMLNGSGAAGNAYSQINAAAGLDLSTLTGPSLFAINLFSLSAPGTPGSATFITTIAQSWTILTTTSTIPDVSVFSFNSSGFTNNLGGGTFSLTVGNSGHDLLLNFNPAFVSPASLVWSGGNAQWNTTDHTWHNTSDNDTAWDNLHFGGTDAVFNTVNTVSVFDSGDSLHGVIAKSLQFGAAATISNAGGGRITLSTGNITVTNGSDTATVAAPIAGTNGLTKLGSGVLVLSGANLYTGATTVSNGVLRIAGGSAIPDGSQVILSAISGFDVNGSTETIGSLTGVGTVALSNGTLITGSDNSDTTYSGQIILNGNLAKTGTGTFTLAAANSFTGTVTVSGGYLSLTHIMALQNATAITIANGAQLQLGIDGTFALGTGVIDLAGVGPSGAANAGALIIGAATVGTVSVSNDINFSADTTINARGGGNTLSLTGKLTGTGNLFRSGSGLLSLDGAPSTGTGGTTLQNGITDANTPNVLMSGPLTMSQSSNSNSPILDINDSQTVGDLSSVYSGTAGSAVNTINIATGKVLTINQMNATAYGTPGSGVDVGKTSTIAGLGGIALSAASTGTLTLDGSNSFSGGVAVNGGELKLNSAGAINSTGANTLTLSGTGKLTLNGQIAGVSDLTGSSLTTIQNAGATGGVLTVNKSTGSSTYSGTLQDGTGGGTLGFTKSGLGEIVLAGNNTYSGPTLVNRGTLRAASSTALGNSPVSVQSASVLANAGTTITNNFTTSVTPIPVTLAQWTFETSQPAAAGPFNPEIGSGSAIGSHSDSGAVYSTPAGNGSSHAFSSNTWNVLDYYQFSTTVTGYGSLDHLTWDQTGSNTGPANFVVNYSTDGVNFSPIGSAFTVTNDSWTASTAVPMSTRSIDVSSINLTGATTITFRIIDTSTTAISSANPVAATGSGRVDNVIITAVNGSLAPVVLGSDAASGSVNFQGSITLNGTTSLTSAAGGTVTFSGVITNGTSSNGITKDDNGTVILSNANTYSAGTLINAGKLIVANTTGSATGTGPVTIAGGVLASGTTGSIAGAVSATGVSSATIAPGDIGVIGSLSLGSTLSLVANSTLNFDINGATQDLLSITGALSVTGTPKITLTTSGTLAGDYVLATYAASGLTNLNFDFTLAPAPVGYQWDVENTFIKLQAVAASLTAGSGSWKNGTGDNNWDTNNNETNNWSTHIPNAVDNIATFADASHGGTTPGVVNLNTAKTIGGIVFNSTTTGYTLGSAASPALNLQVSTGSASIQVSGSAAHIIAATVNTLSDTTINADATTSLTFAGGLTNASSTVAITGAGNVHIAGLTNTGTVSVAGTGAHNFGAIAGAPGTPHLVGAVNTPGTAAQLSAAGATSILGNAQVTATRIWQNTLTIGDGASTTGAKLTIPDSSPTYAENSLVPSGNDAFVSVLKTLTIPNAGGFKGTLDLGNNDLIIDYTATPGSSPITSIEAMIRSGYNNGHWNGTGITSSTAALNPGRFALTVIDNQTLPTHFNTFDGIDTSSHDQVIVKFSWVADLDLDGQVTSNDAITFAAHYSEGHAANHQTGDLNYNGVFDSNDAILFAAAYNETLPHLPEPASLGILALGAGALLMKRRK